MTAEPTRARAVATQRLRQLLPLISIVLLAGAFWVLHRELTLHHPRDFWLAIGALPMRRILLALLLSALGYLILTGYDALGQRYVRHRVGARRTLFTGFVGYAFSQALGLPWLTGGSLRYRLYTAWGLSGVEIAQIIAFAGLTYWLGVLSLAGTALAVAPANAAGVVSLPLWTIRAMGLAVLAVPLGYLTATWLRREPIQVLGWSIQPPPFPLAAIQVGVGCLDWTIAASVLYTLLPAGAHVPFGTFVAVYVIAHAAGVLSHVPGGLGVFESVVVLAFRGQLEAPVLLGSLVVYRVVFHLVPFLTAATLLTVYEGRERRETVSRVAKTIGRWVPALAPRALAVVTFLAGAAMLFSGALPAEGSRVRWLAALVPLSIIELSHFLGSVIGLVLLILSWGIARRLDGAFHVAVVLLVGGIAAVLLRGVDYGEAAVLAVVLLVLLPAREQFNRRASLLHEPFSPAWFVAIGTVVISSIWLGMFAFRHVPYRDDLWWQFTLRGDAPRFLRASVGVVVAAAIFGLARLLRPASMVPRPPSPDDLKRAASLIERSTRPDAHLALLGDQALLFDPGGSAFIMYGVSGRSWVAMGDPVGDGNAFADLVWEFRELAGRYGGVTTFYQAADDHLPLYLELGLHPLKIGEEASVMLRSFVPERDSLRDLVSAHRDAEREGCRFELVSRDQVPGLLGELKAISDQWLANRAVRERGFSMGRFSLDYVSQLPVAVVRLAGRIMAFANLWLAAGKSEMAIDLLRYRAQAPRGVMPYLLLEAVLWGVAQGYQRFNLGTVPLSDREGQALAPLAAPMAALGFRHSGHFPDSHALRRFVEQFGPEWSPRYLVTPSGLALPRILGDIAALISGGAKRTSGA